MAYKAFLSRWRNRQRLVLCGTEVYETLEAPEGRSRLRAYLGHSLLGRDTLCQLNSDVVGAKSRQTDHATGDSGRGGLVLGL